MPRSARLKNIAAGLCGSFAGRDNDLGGYWAIGKLRLLAGQQSQTAIAFDVLAPSMQPPSPEFAQVLVAYHRLLRKLASRSGIRFEEITAACIAVDFSPPPWRRAIYYKQQWGEQFLVTVTVSADGRADGIMRHAGYCRPHDPDKERRRAFSV